MCTPVFTIDRLRHFNIIYSLSCLVFNFQVRWVVEAANARIKRWKYFANILQTNQVPYISENTKIICAICNKFFPPLSSGAAEEDEILAAKMKFLSKEINSLKSFVKENNLERKSAKWEITEDIKDFPFLGEQELRNITCGVYQLKLSPS